jgi:hypothetical protein
LFMAGDTFIPDQARRGLWRRVKRTVSCAAPGIVAEIEKRVDTQTGHGKQSSSYLTVLHLLKTVTRYQLGRQCKPGRRQNCRRSVVTLTLFHTSAGSVELAVTFSFVLVLGRQANDAWGTFKFDLTERRRTSGSHPHANHRS